MYDAMRSPTVSFCLPAPGTILVDVIEDNTKLVKLNVGLSTRGRVLVEAAYTFDSFKSGL